MKDPSSEEGRSTGVFQRVYALGGGNDFVIFTGGSRYQASPENEWAGAVYRNDARMLEFEAKLKNSGKLESLGSWNMVLGDQFFVFLERDFDKVFSEIWSMSKEGAEE